MFKKRYLTVAAHVSTATVVNAAAILFPFQRVKDEMETAVGAIQCK